MTNDGIKKLRAALEHQQAALRAERQDRKSMTIETSPDELDRIQQARDRDESIHSLERQSHRLREVRTALRRLEEGQSGICVNCESEISPRRLAAVPWTPHCIACQEEAEREAQAPPSDDSSVAIAS